MRVCISCVPFWLKLNPRFLNVHRLLNVELVFSYSFASMLLVSLQSLVVVGDVGCFFGFPVAILFATRWRFVAFPHH